MVTEIISAFILIFFAEMGDKSQILAMTFASKYKLKYVIIGLFLGITINHLLAVILGSYLDYILPVEMLSIIAGFLFILFGIWSLSLTENVSDNKVAKYGPIITVSLAFFIGELGDKTQLATIALASDSSYPFLILLGTVTGMMVTSIIGIYIGVTFGKKIDDYYLKLFSSLIFIGFGVIKVINSIDVSIVPYYAIILFTLSLTAILVLRYIPLRKQHISNVLSLYQETAETLFNYYHSIRINVESICLGENECGKCGGTECLIGYTKRIINSAIKNEEEDIVRYTEFLEKDFDQKKILDALKLTVNSIGKWNAKEYDAVHRIRQNLERILFGKSIYSSSIRSYKKHLEEAYKNEYEVIFKSH